MYFFLLPQMLLEPDRVSAVRLVLRQPSPVWAQFGVEDVSLTQHNFKVILIWSWLYSSHEILGVTSSVILIQVFGLNTIPIQYFKTQNDFHLIQFNLQSHKIISVQFQSSRPNEEKKKKKNGQNHFDFQFWFQCMEME